MFFKIKKVHFFVKVLYTYQNARCNNKKQTTTLTFKRRIKSRLPFAGIIRSSPYSTRFRGKG